MILLILSVSRSAIKESPYNSRATHHMITKSNKKIKKQLSSFLHLQLHSPTPLECAPRPNDKRKVMRPQLGLRVWSISVSVSRTGQDRAARDAGMQALFAQGQTLQRGEVVLLSGAVDCRIA